MGSPRLDRILDALAALDVSYSSEGLGRGHGIVPELALHEAAHMFDLGLTTGDGQRIGNALFSLPVRRRRFAEVRAGAVPYVVLARLGVAPTMGVQQMAQTTVRASRAAAVRDVSPQWTVGGLARDIDRALSSPRVRAIAEQLLALGEHHG